MSYRNQHPIIVFSEKNNLANTQDMTFKITIINMCKELKENMNKCLNEDHKTIFFIAERNNKNNEDMNISEETSH